MRILAVDTSSKNCSVSIVEVDNDKNFKIIAEDNNNDERTHSVKLMPMIDNIFKSSNLILDNIDLLACCLGPGSFTGIRIGIATVKAFAIFSESSWFKFSFENAWEKKLEQEIIFSLKTKINAAEIHATKNTTSVKKTEA